MNLKKLKQTQTGPGKRGGPVLIGVTALSLMLMSGSSGFSATAKKVEQQVGKSIDTRQATQKKQETWDSEKSELMVLYDQLSMENEHLTAANKILKKALSGHEQVNRDLEAERLEAMRIKKEMMPFLLSVQQSLKDLMDQDVPFLTAERQTRLARLSHTMDDMDVSIAEKYRKVMEALSIEAEYGNTIEVYQDKILLEGSEVLGDIFRLGRISLFFLTLDREAAAVFNVSENNWQALDKRYMGGLDAAVEMAAKRRPMEVINLPLGRLAGPSGQ